MRVFNSTIRAYINGIRVIEALGYVCIVAYRAFSDGHGFYSPCWGDAENAFFSKILIRDTKSRT